MSPLTLDVKELRERWMRLYVNICVLRSYNPEALRVLKAFKEKLYGMNEEFMAFFDALERPMEAEEEKPHG